MQTTNFEINILKNEVEGARGQKITKLIYFSVYLFIGVFAGIYNLIKGAPWSNYYIGLAALGFSLIMYLQLTGKWIYKRFIAINNDTIEWKEARYNFVNLKWTQINQVNSDSSLIIFHLNKGNSKQFPLTHITGEQATKLKELLNQFSNEKGIQYISK